MTLNSRSRNNLISSTLICLIFMINELVFGILSHSVAMATTPCVHLHAPVLAKIEGEEVRKHPSPRDHP